MVINLWAVIGTLLVVGVLLWGLNRLNFIDAQIKNIIYVIVVVVFALWLIGLIFPSVYGPLNIHVGR